MADERNHMPVEYLNPEGLFQPTSYWQGAIATGTRTLYLSGQADRGLDALPVAGAGDLAGQVEQALVNVDLAVRGAGGTFDDIAKLTVYLVDWNPDKLADVGAGIQRAAERIGRDLRKPATFIGVAALFTPDLLVEVEAIAVLP